MSLPALRSRVQVKSLTSNLISISAQGKTAAQAEDIANAVADSYVAYVRTADSAAGTVQARRAAAGDECHGDVAARLACSLLACSAPCWAR